MFYAFDPPTWNDVTGAIFMGAQGAFPSWISFLGIGICVLSLFFGNRAEAKKYADYK